MKRVLVFGPIALLTASLWYLFIKPYDYSATITAKTFPGAINQTIKAWNASLKDSQFTRQEGLNYLQQEVAFNDSTFLFEWNIESLNDSTSKIRVFIKDVHHSLQNRLGMPFSTTDFEKRAEKTLLDFNQTLNNHIKSFKVTVVGIDSIAPTYCAYVSLASKQIEKAKGMMLNYPLLDQMVAKNKLSSKGKPFIEVLQWNMQNDSIRYNFCYPITPSDSLPQIKNIKYRQFKGAKGLKAIYNGNYITSDRAWYALLAYAESHGLHVEKKPLEVFYTNPNFGGDELQWKTEIFMPLKE